jgi:hypothetical protein
MRQPYPGAWHDAPRVVDAGDGGGIGDMDWGQFVIQWLHAGPGGRAGLLAGDLENAGADHHAEAEHDEVAGPVDHAEPVPAAVEPAGRLFHRQPAEHVVAHAHVPGHRSSPQAGGQGQCTRAAVREVMVCRSP